MNQPGHLLSSDGLVAMQKSFTSKRVTQRRQQTKHARSVGNTVYCVRKKRNMPVKVKVKLTSRLLCKLCRDVILFYFTLLGSPSLTQHTLKVYAAAGTPRKSTAPANVSDTPVSHPLPWVRPCTTQTCQHLSVTWRMSTT